jgi:cytidylate kinase
LRSPPACPAASAAVKLPRRDRLEGAAIKAVICISHATGSGGENVGRAVSARLNYHYVDEDIVLRAAAKENLDPRVIEDVERRQSFMSRLLESLERGATLDAMNPEGFPRPDVVEAALEVTKLDYRALIREVIAETADRGEVVIVAHAASMALAGRDSLLRILITASDATRAERLATAGGLSEADAVKLVRETDRARANYFKRFYKISHEGPTHYDLVINTDTLKIDQAVDVIASAAGG